MHRVVSRLLDYLRRAWFALQLKHHGRYSVDRVAALAHYEQERTVVHKSLAIALTPFPALIALILIDIPRLDPPEAGWKHYGRFWIRAFFTAMLIIGTVLLQLHCLLPRQRVTRWQLIVITTVTSLNAIAFTMALSSAIGFPLPFTITLCGPATNVSLTICGYIAWGDQLKRDAELRRKLLHYATFSSIQIMLIIVYPVFAYAFIGADIITQTFLACVLPMIKLLMKAWLAKYMADSPELRPQFLILQR